MPGIVLSGLCVASFGCHDRASDASALRATRLKIKVVDAQTGALLPALVTFRDGGGLPVKFGNFTDLPAWGQAESAKELDPKRPGVFAFLHGLAFWKGEGTVMVGKPWTHRDVSGKTMTQSQVPFGNLELEVTHGPEFDSYVTRVDVSPDRGEVSLVVPLQRTVDSAEYISADLHVHNKPESNDSGTDPSSQLKVSAVNGLDVVVLSNHDALLDPAPLVATLWPQATRPIVALSGQEVGGPAGHFGVFPLPVDVRKPRGGAPAISSTAPSLFANVRALTSKPLLIVNHPRLGWSAYFDSGSCGDWAKGDLLTPPPCSQDFDGFEVLNAWQVCSSRIRVATDTWLALMRFGFVTAAVAGSDSHYTGGMVPGYPRTWIRAKQGGDAKMNMAALVDGVRARRTSASTAALLSLRVGAIGEGEFLSTNAPAITVAVRVQAANWVSVQTARLLVDGQVVESWTIGSEGKAIDFRKDAVVQLPAADAALTLETDSAAILPPQLVGQYTSALEYGRSKCVPRAGEEPGMPAFATTSPILIDRDNDGLFRGRKL